MAHDFLNQPLGHTSTGSSKGGRTLWLPLLLVAVVLAGGAGFVAWQNLRPAREPQGVVAVIKPAEPPAPVSPPAKTVASTPDNNAIPVFRPPGAPNSTGVFIKVPQDGAGDEPTAPLRTRPVGKPN